MSGVGFVDAYYYTAGTTPPVLPTSATGSPVRAGITVPGGMIRLASDPPPALISAEVFRHPNYVTPALTISGLSGYSWQDRVGEAGHGEIAIPNLHDDQSGIELDDLVRFSVQGHAAFTVALAGRQNDQHPAGGTTAPTTTWQGPGHVGLLSEMLVLPSNGPGSLPIEIDRIFSWPSPPFDDVGWSTAVELVTVADAQTGAWPYDPVGDGFPIADPAWFIWAAGSTTTLAPIGDCYFRRKFTTDAGRVIVYLLLDDWGDVYFDGVKILEVGPADAGFSAVITKALDVSAGEHTLAVWCHNGVGPGAVAIAVYKCDVNSEPVPGLPPLVVTDSSWKIVAYPPQPPGMTPGEVLILIMEEAQTLGFLVGWTWTFTKDVDSTGVPWPEYGDISTKVGTDYLTFILDELAQTYCDVRAQPGGLVLDAYAHGTLGTVTGVDLHAATDPDDPSSGNVTELSYSEQATTTTGFLVRWQGGWRLVDRASGGRKKLAVLGLGALPSMFEVDRVANGQLDRHAHVRNAITTGYHPSPAEPSEWPYAGFRAGDVVTVPGEDGTPAQERVMGITVRGEGSTLAPKFALEIIDVLRQQWEREQTALKKMADGTLRGDARPAQPTFTVGFTGPGPNCCPPVVQGGGGG